MLKRGQITIFVIIAIALIGAVSTVYLFREQLGITNPIIQDSREIKEYIQYCVDISLIDAVRLVGLQGGYILVPNNSAKTEFGNVAYGMILANGTNETALTTFDNSLATKETIEKEIDSYINFVVPICLNKENYQTLDIDIENINTKTKINEGYVSADIVFPVTISRGDSSSRLSDPYESKVLIRLGKIYEFSQKIIQEEIKDPNYIDISQIVDSEYFISVLPIDEKTNVYTIIDNSSQIENAPYTFRFANRLS